MFPPAKQPLSRPAGVGKSETCVASLCRNSASAPESTTDNSTQPHRCHGVALFAPAGNFKEQKNQRVLDESGRWRQIDRSANTARDHYPDHRLRRAHLASFTGIVALDLRPRSM